jgi:HK97 family phage major capsid protein
MPENFEEVKKAFDNLQKTVVDMKAANDAREADLKKKGFEPSEIKGKIERINTSVDQALERVKALEVAGNRTGAASEDTEEANEKAKKAASKAFQKYLRRGEKALNEEDVKAMAAVMPEVKALSTDSDPDGGYFVQPERSAEIQKKLFESSPVRQIASIETIGSDSFEELSDYDELDANWVGERSSRTESDTSQVSKLVIPVHEMTASPKASQKLLDDALVNIEQWLNEKVSDKFARKEATAFVSGDGVNQPKGFLSYGHGDGFGLVERVASGVAGDFDGDDLIGLQDTLLEGFQAGASWAMRRATRSVCRQLKDGVGQYLWSVDRGLNGMVQETILGKPVVLMADMPAIGANALAIAYGDFKKGYLVVDRIGIRVLRDPFTAKPHVVFYTTKRVGGGVRHFQAIKLLRLSATPT